MLINYINLRYILVNIANPIKGFVFDAGTLLSLLPICKQQCPYYWEKYL